jgi:hypothetical protein
MMFQLLRLTCVFALAALTLPAQTVAAATNVRTTGMVGLADSQTARLNLLNPGALAAASEVTCTAKVSFVDGQGNVLKSATLTIAPGKSAALDLRSDTDLSLIAGDRREIRAVISSSSIVPPPTAVTAAPVTPACATVPTLEIFDTVSGRTLLTLGHTVTVPAVQ